jgi:hypothetical protein
VGNYNLGFLLYKSGKSQEAAACLQRALQVDPQLAPAQQLLATISGQDAVNLATARPAPPAEPRGAGSTPQWATSSYAAPAGHQLPQSLPAIGDNTEDWGDAPTPDSLPQLLPPVR